MDPVGGVMFSSPMGRIGKVTMSGEFFLGIGERC